MMRETWDKAALDKANHWQALGFDTFAEELRALVREYADTEAPPCEGDEVPSMRHPSDIPTSIDGL